MHLVVQQHVKVIAKINVVMHAREDAQVIAHRPANLHVLILAKIPVRVVREHAVVHAAPHARVALEHVKTHARVLVLLHAEKTAQVIAVIHVVVVAQLVVKVHAKAHVREHALANALDVKKYALIHVLHHV